jgi:hypothetical protein
MVILKISAHKRYQMKHVVYDTLHGVITSIPFYLILLTLIKPIYISQTNILNIHMYIIPMIDIWNGDEFETAQ